MLVMAEQLAGRPCNLITTVTSFPLLGLHRLVSCAQCHATLALTGADSVHRCHTHDDVHHGGLGSKCESCHSANDWALWRFDHAKQTISRSSGRTPSCTVRSAITIRPARARCRSSAARATARMIATRAPYGSNASAATRPLPGGARGSNRPQHAAHEHREARATDGTRRLVSCSSAECDPDWIARAAVGGLAAPAPALASSASRSPCRSIISRPASSSTECTAICRASPVTSMRCFSGTPRDCGTCHIKGSPYNATPKTDESHAEHQQLRSLPQHDHVSSARALRSRRGARRRASAVTTAASAQGEGPTHPATSQECAACHLVTTWNPPKTVDHTQIPLAVQGYCIICHNGTQASGKTGQPRGHHARVRRLPPHEHLARRELRSHRHHHRLLQLSQRQSRPLARASGHMPTSNLCENCHTTGIGTSTPSWVPSLFDHTQMTVSTCQTCHSGTVKISTGFVSGQPANHVPPIPSAIDCGVCHGNNPSAETWTVLAASIPTLHAGLPVSNCLLCHAGETFAGVPGPYIPMSMSGVSPTHPHRWRRRTSRSSLARDCSACHGAAYQAGGFGPATAMSAAKHAFVSTTCDTCHETGRSFYVGSGTPLQLRPADHAGEQRSAHGEQRLLGLPHDHRLEQHRDAAQGTCPIRANSGCAMPCHTAPQTITRRHTRADCGTAHRHHRQLRSVPWRHHHGTDLVQQLHAQGCDARASAHSLSVGHRLQLLPRANYVTGGFGPMNMSAAKHAFVAHLLRHLSRGGSELLHGRSKPARCRAAPPITSRR